MLQWQEQNEKHDEPAGYMNIYSSDSFRRVPSSTGEMGAAGSSDSCLVTNTVSQTKI